MSGVPGAHGDQDLAAEVGRRLGGRHRVFAAAVVEPGRTRVAGVGAGLDADFELGSVSKGVTGLLYADALARGEVAASTRLGELLSLGDCPAAAVGLGALATHRSGLPRLAPSSHVVRGSLALWRTGANPYGQGLADLLDQTRTAKVGRPRPRYSNLGFQLLGHAVAAAAGSSYADLVRDRLALPLALETVTVPSAPDLLRPGAVRGTDRRGRPREPWTGEAVGPAGGVRASIADTARLAAALLDETAPGLAALDPVEKFVGPVRIGAGWITVERAGRQVTWHNGATGGTRSWIGLDRAAGTAVVLLSATTASVDRTGFDLLAGLATA